MDPQDTQDTRDVNPAAAAPWRKIAIMVLAALAVGLLLFIVGLSRGKNEVRTQKAAHEVQVSALEKDLAGTRQQLTSSQARGDLMQAQLALYRTALELDRRNFGLANGHLQQAGEALKRAGAAAGNDDLARLAATISAMDVTVAANLQQQRNQVLAHAEALDAVIAERGASTAR